MGCLQRSVEMPMFDYEKLLFGALQEHKHIWILKATGLGITEFFLRYIAWKCLFNDDLKGSHICLITGPRIELAITLIDRLKKLFHKLNVYSENKETVLILNQVRIEAFPSHHLNTMRGLPHVSFILLDEGDFLPKGEQQEVRDVIERYIGKSNPHIVLVSTPNSPTSLFAQIDKEDPSIYYKLKLDYTFGLGKIYTPEEIEEAKKSISFPREYDLQFLGLLGNTFHSNDIQRAIELGSRYDSDLVQQSTQKVLGIDPGWGSSAFGLCLLEFVDGVIHVRLAHQEYDRNQNICQVSFFGLDFYRMAITLVNLIPFVIYQGLLLIVLSLILLQVLIPLVASDLVYVFVGRGRSRQL